MTPSSNRIRFVDDNMQDNAFFEKGCCFNFSCFGESSRTTSSQRKIVREKVQWWRKIREWSKHVASSKWKNLVRRLNNKNRAIGYRKQGSFRYDDRSYARNFDEGTKEKREEHYAYDFSSR
ncbi:uncharacterized protein LOC124842900 [Vigna umbellata]|uniref:uncharacterized protein LOC124842900 n=1 Tax=Vigna umbellata TaxID=87088 RepID=UPI001F5F3214|nr:uncharacterized protein LOC124842900 [Vigna umbellata]